MALAALLVVAIGVYTTRDRTHLQPDHAQIEALVGTSLGVPTYTSWHWARRVRLRITSWIRYWSSPVLNQMEMWPMGRDVWTYTFEADSTYRAPADSPLDCPALEHAYTRWCSAERTIQGRRWIYTLYVHPDEGYATLTAQLP